MMGDVGVEQAFPEAARDFGDGAGDDGFALAVPSADDQEHPDLERLRDGRGVAVTGGVVDADAAGLGAGSGPTGAIGGQDVADQTIGDDQIGGSGQGLRTPSASR